MKSRLLWIGFIASTAWALIISGLYWQLKNNPKVVAVTMDAGKNSLQNIQMGEVEKITFLRQYLERYFNYDSDNFWQSQTSLAFLMTGKLGEERIREVSRLRDKIQQKNLSQRAQLQSLQQTSTGTYEALLHLQLTENSQSHQLYVTLKLSLQTTERTLENPWGLLVSDMTFVTTTPHPPAAVKLFAIQKSIPFILTVPCALENVENPDESNLKIKVTTLNGSELQFTTLKDLTTPLRLLLQCKTTEFPLELTPSKTQTHLFAALSGETGSPRPKGSSTGKPRQKDVYEKTIESVLGIKLDQ